MRRQLCCAALAIFVSTSAFATPRARGHNLIGKPAVAPTAGESLLYYGGPVIPNPRVYVIWWGSKVGISFDLTQNPGGIDSFFDGVLDSAFIDAWAQYGTNLVTQAGTNKGMPGTNQLIGRGNFAGEYTLSPVPSGDVTDAQIQTALEAAITAGTLPPNDPNTIYAVFFPPAVIINADGAMSCTGFGAYHDRTVVQGAGYLVVPDCGDGFLDFCSVTSHELAEATTDLRPTPGSNPDFPQAWNDSQGNEAADICEGSGGLMPTEGGQFAVQGIWDQRGDTCATTAHAANDFSVAVSPHAWNMAAGDSATINVVTALVAGSAQSLALSVVAPAGVTATLAASTLQAGASTTLTVSPANALRDGQVVVSAVSGSGATAWTHTAALLVNATAAPVANDFSLSITPADQTVAIDTYAMYQVQTAVVGGVPSNIALSVNGLPAGMIAAFTPGIVDAGSSSMLSLKTFGRTPGSYPFSVVGVADATHTATASLELVVATNDGGTSTGSDAGTPADGGVTTSNHVSSGCGNAPASALALPLLIALLFAGARRQRRSL